MANTYKIIDPKSLSYETIRKNLVDYLSNLPDYAKWKDFFESGAGTTQVELLSGLGTYLSWHSLGARRESYLDTAQLYTSAVGICNILGYPVNRLSCPRLRVSFTSKTSVYWDRENPLFYYNGVSFSLLHSQTINVGVNELILVGGDWQKVEMTSKNNEKFYNFLVLDTGIDNNDLQGQIISNTTQDTLELFCNGTALQLVKYSDELLPNNVIIKTYNDGVLISFGDGVLGKQIRVNDEIVFNYLKTSGPLGVISILPQELTPNHSCVVTSVSMLVPGYNEDSLSKLSILAPGYISSKRRMVTGTDHKFILEAYSGSMISANYNKAETDCCTIQLAYLFDDEHFATFTEKDSIYEYLDDYKVVGAKLQLVDPIKIGVEVKLVVVTEEGVDESELITSVNEVIQEYVMKLGVTLHIGEITTMISQLDGVKRVYLVRPVSDKTLAFQYYLKLINLQLTITTDSGYTVSVSPDNNGYWRFACNGTCTSVAENKLIDTSGGFENKGLVPGSLIVNIPANLEATVISVDSDTEITLSADIFLEADQPYEAYSANA